MASVTLNQLLAGIRQQESGGNYSVVNSIGAVGAYQVLKSNIPSWTKEALGHSLTWEQYRDDPAAQDKTARYIIGGYYDKYGAAGAAAMWYSGQPDPTKTYGNPSVATYVRQVLAKASGSGSGLSGGSGTTSTPSGGTGSTTVQQAGWLGDVGGWIGGLVSSGVGDVAGMLGTVFTPLGNVAKDLSSALSTTMHAILWLVNPMNWVRIFAGVIGGISILAGAWLVAGSA